MQRKYNIVAEDAKGYKVEFSIFSDFLKFYYKNIVGKDSVSWTDFVYNNYSNGDSKREINGYTITGANETLQAEILDYYRGQGFEVFDKSSGFNIGCKIKNLQDEFEYIKTPSTGVTGRYNWLNEIFIYKLLEKLGYGTKVNFDVLDFAPIALIRGENIQKDGDEFVQFKDGEHKSVGMKEKITKDELRNIGVAEVLVGRVLLLDDLHYKEGTNYSFLKDENGKLKLQIFDLMSQHYNIDNKTTNKQFGYSIDKEVFYTKRDPYYAVSGSFLNQDVRNLGIDLGITEIEKNKLKFQNVIKESEAETYQVLNNIKEQFPEEENQKIISELYNQKAFHEFKRTVSDNLENIENFHSSSIAVKPSATLILSNCQDQEIYDKQMAVIYNGKNDTNRVKEQGRKFQDYLRSRNSDFSFKK